MLFSLLYMVLRVIFRLAPSGDERNPDVEILVPRHQVKVLKRKAGLKDAETPDSALDLRESEFAHPSRASSDARGCRTGRRQQRAAVHRQGEPPVGRRRPAAGTIRSGVQPRGPGRHHLRRRRRHGRRLVRGDRSGRRVILTDPTYAGMIESRRIVGAVPPPGPLQPEDGEWRLDADALGAIVTDRTRAIFVANPGMPTGNLLNDDEWG